MADPVYPSTLPAPQALRRTPLERRQLSAVDRPRDSRPLQFDRGSTENITWPPLTTAQLETLMTWWRGTLHLGGSWFSSSWPCPQGRPVLVRKFTEQPRRTFMAGGFWRVTATVEVRGVGQIPIERDPYQSYVRLLMHMNSDFVDVIGHAMTARGGAVINGGVGLFNLEGVNGFVSADEHSYDFYFGSGDFTIESYIRPDTVSGVQLIAGIWAIPNYDAASNNLWRFFIGDDGAIVFSYRGVDSYQYLFETGIGVVSAGVDQHVSVTKQGDTIRLTVNGVTFPNTVSRTNTGSFIAYSGPLPTMWSATSEGPHLNIGRLQDAGSLTGGGTWYYGGTMHDMRITAIARYTSSFTPPLTPLVY